MNNRIHGMTSNDPVAHALPNEDPAEIQGRQDEWVAYYQPVSPAARHYLKQCVRASLLDDRCHHYQDFVLKKQVREAAENHRQAQADDVEHYINMLKTSPAAAVYGLGRSVAGNLWRAGRLQRLLEILDEQGYWAPSDRDEATRLLGFPAGPEHLKESAESFRFRLYNLVARGNPAQKALDWLFHESRVPDDIRGVHAPNCYPEPADCRQSLRTAIADAHAATMNECNRLWDAFEKPAQDEAADRAVVITDPEKARLFLRYRGEARTSFQRSFGGLVATLDRDRAEAAEAVREEAKASASPAPSATPSEVVSRVEANDPGERQLTPEESSSCGDIDAPVSGPEDGAGRPEPAAPETRVTTTPDDVPAGLPVSPSEVVSRVEANDPGERGLSGADTVTCGNSDSSVSDPDREAGAGGGTEVAIAAGLLSGNAAVLNTTRLRL